MTLRLLFVAMLATLLTSLVSLPTNAADEYPSSEDELANEIAAMPWEYDPGQYTLPRSNSSLRLSEGSALLRGDAARRLMYLSEGNKRPDTEAVVVDLHANDLVDYSFSDVGYVTLDDWSDVDPDELLELIKEVTDEENAQRKPLGLPSLVVTRWIIEPTLLREREAVTWAVELDNAGTPLANVVTLKLGRSGYERLTWVGTKEAYDGRTGISEALVDSHEFESGSRYADFNAGDKLAGFGIAALVAVTAGAQTKVGKGILATIGAFILKFIWVPIIAAVGAAFAFSRRYLGGAKKNRPPPKRE